MNMANTVPGSEPQARPPHVAKQTTDIVISSGQDQDAHRKLPNGTNTEDTPAADHPNRSLGHPSKVPRLRLQEEKRRLWSVVAAQSEGFRAFTRDVEEEGRG